MLTLNATVEIAEADVKSEEPSPVSPMPAGLVNGLTREQVIELMAPGRGYIGEGQMSTREAAPRRVRGPRPLACDRPANR